MEKYRGYIPTEPNLNDALSDEQRDRLNTAVREGYGDVALDEAVILGEVTETPDSDQV